MTAVSAPGSSQGPSDDSKRVARSRPVVASCFAIGLIALGGVAGAGRHALWQVVRACVADYQTTGAPYPCLAVDLSGGVDRGAVVLRPPFGAPDTILSPTRAVVGVEDPWLQSPTAPNYFAAALQARAFVRKPDGSAPKLDEVALAANSRFARTQDQLHIHVGCASPRIRQALRLLAASQKVGDWTPIGALGPSSELWGMRAGRPNLDQIEPFRLAAQRFAAEDADLSRLTIAAVGMHVDDHDEMALLVVDDRGAENPDFPADEIVDSRCRAFRGSAAAR